MSSIEERIQKHKIGLEKADNLCEKYRCLMSKHGSKADFHKNAIINLEAKKAKQEKKVE